MYFIWVLGKLRSLKKTGKLIPSLISICCYFGTLHLLGVGGQFDFVAVGESNMAQASLKLST